jgi:hypothetical protein
MYRGGETIRQLLQICDVSDLAASEQNFGQVGNEEIQEVEKTSKTGGVLVRENSPKAARTVSALEDGYKTDG